MQDTPHPITTASGDKLYGQWVPVHLSRPSAENGAAQGSGSVPTAHVLTGRPLASMSERSRAAIDAVLGAACAMLDDRDEPAAQITASE